MNRAVVLPTLFLVATGTSAFAQTSATAVMPVTATVAASCTVAAAPLAFGTLALNGSNTDSQTSIVLTCTPGTTYAVGLDTGAHAASGVRNMAGTLPGSLVPYHIYSNAARTAEWGNSFGTNTVGGTAAAAATTLTVYGRVTGQADLFPSGGYTDSVIVTVRF